MAATKLQLTVRQVQRVTEGEPALHGELEKHAYAVYEAQDDGTWLAVSKTYAHSTSALAKLGRLVQQEVTQELYKR